ncbi:MAG: polysaccharide pyruvyl transferase family protein [Thalassotalea sp.]
MNEINIDDYLSQYREHKLCYIPNPGNAGDNIIAAGTLQRFKRLGLDYRLVDRHRLALNNEIVFYSGGGNLGKMSNFSVSCLSRIHKNVQKLVILPHTIKDISPLLLEFGANTDIICRELVSYQYVSKSGTKANVYLAHDMALGLAPSELLSFDLGLFKKIQQCLLYVACKLHLSTKQAPTKHGLLSLFNNKAEMIIAEKKHTSILNAYRTDGEKTNIKLPADNVDLSEELAIGVETETLTFLGAARFLRVINEFETINTNRLHVAVAATLLGKNVNFFANNYFKCKAVYDYSLTNFSNLKFIE